MASMDSLCLMNKGTKRREALSLSYMCCDLDYICVDLYFYVSCVDEDLRDVLSAKKLVTDGDDSCSVQDIPLALRSSSFCVVGTIIIFATSLTNTNLLHF